MQVTSEGQGHPARLSEGQGLPVETQSGSTEAQEFYLYQNRVYHLKRNPTTITYDGKGKLSRYTPWRRLE
jgi:hypothetical protein